MPTVRQQIAVQKLSEIIRKAKGQKNITIGKILKEAGYSDSVSESPTLVTKSKGWDQLVQQYMPEEEVAKIHGGLLKASKMDSYNFPCTMTDEEIKDEVEAIDGCKARKIIRSGMYATCLFWSPDSNARDKAVDKFYKLLGKYSAEKVEHSVDQEIREHLDRLSGLLPK